MFGCYLARELFPDSTLYYSKDTHYSVGKIAKLLQMKSCVIESLDNGEIDYDDLIHKIKPIKKVTPLFLQILVRP